MAKVKLSDYVISFLAEHEVGYVFGYIGGAITHLVDSASKNRKIKFIQVYHEQTASIAAEGYARQTGNIGVAAATSGPGATNMVTGIADAYFDSIPTIYLTGQVNTYEYKYDKKVRQQGFQETDIVSIVKPVTKYAKLVDKPEEIRFELEKAFYLAKEGRPGPVLLDLPMDIQRAEIDPGKLKKFIPEKSLPKELNLLKIKKMLEKSSRPIILAGGGAVNSGAEKELFRFAKKNNIPVVTSLMGKGSFPEEHSLFIGMIGSYGNRAANIALSNADLLLAIGSRLDTRQVGTNLKSFLRSGRIVHIDIDKNELKHNRLNGRITLNIDAKNFLKKINDLKIEKRDRPLWVSYIKKITAIYNQKVESERRCPNKTPYDLMEVLNKVSLKDQIFTVDIGQNQMFAGQGLTIRERQRFYTSGGMAPMGYAMPVAIGASFADKKKKIIAITGDGGFHISTQSLMLISQYNLPIKVIILNNASLGMIVQFQDLYFDSNEVATTKSGGYLVPDFKAMSAAYGLPFIKIGDLSRQRKRLEEALASPGGMIIEVNTGGKTIVAPKLEVNCPIEDMNPRLDKAELRDNMIIDLFGEGKE
ncbi:MAG: thiamine pyrophosphate-binding protein [Patescibacteria group bacterium]